MQPTRFVAFESWASNLVAGDTNGILDVFVCMHPQVIGRGHRIAMLERFVEHCLSAGARFASLGAVASAL